MPPGLGETLGDARRRYIREISAGRKGMEAHAIAHLAAELEHGRADRRHRDRDAQQPRRFRREVGCHEVEIVGVAMEIEGCLALPGLPDCAHSGDVVAHAWRRRRPSEAVAPLVVRLHLRP